MKLFLLGLMVFSISLNHAVTVSQGTYGDKVELSWTADPQADYYQIQRVYDTPYNTVQGKEKTLETNTLTNITATSFVDKTIPFGQHLYIVTAYKDTNIIITNKRKITTNHLVTSINQGTGYRQVSDKEFFLEFQKGIDSSLPRIRTMKMLNFFGEKKKGWRNGQLVYKTTGIIRRPFRVMIEYTDFVDQTLKLNGTYEVQIFKLFSQEGKLVGTFNVDGIYQGTVTHNLIIDGGKSVGGVYEVQQKGKPMVSLPYDITSHPLDDSQYEEALKQSLKESETPK